MKKATYTIDVEICAECPFFTRQECNWFCGHINGHRRIRDDEVWYIPAWCPLPEAKGREGA